MLQVEELRMELMLTMRSIMNFSAPKYTPSDVVDEVCQALGLSVQMVISSSRKSELVEARFIITAILYSDGIPSTEIMAAVGSKERTMIYYNIKKYENLLDSKDKKFDAQLELVQPQFSWINLKQLPQKWKKH